MQALQDWQGLTGVGGDCLTSEKAKSFFAAVDWGHVVGWPQHLELPRGYEPILKQKRENPAWLIGHRCKDNQSTLDFIGVDAVVVSELLDRKLSVGAAGCAPGLFSFCLHAVNVSKIAFPAVLCVPPEIRIHKP